jgi:hypothetical protein
MQLRARERASLLAKFNNREESTKGRMNYSRPRHRTAGRSTESVSGGMPSEFFAANRYEPDRKRRLRLENEKAIREYMAKTSVKPVSSIPDDGDGQS